MHFWTIRPYKCWALNFSSGVLDKSVLDANISGYILLAQ